MMVKKSEGNVRHSSRQLGLAPRPLVKQRKEKKQKIKKVTDILIDINAQEVLPPVEDVGEDTWKEIDDHQVPQNVVPEADKELVDGEVLEREGNDLEREIVEEPLFEQADEELGAASKGAESQVGGVEEEDVEEQSEANDQESQPTAEETQPKATEEGQPEKSDRSKMNVRGKTRMRKLAKEHRDIVDVEFSELGEYAGKGSIKLLSFLGPLVREHLPVLLDDWRLLDEQTRHILWEEVKGKFNMTEEWQKDSVFKQMGCLWRSLKSKLVTQVRNAKTAADRLSLKPSNISSTTAWKNWVRSRCTTEFKVKSDKYREMRKAQIPHTTSRKGMFHLCQEMKKNSSTPSTVTRSKIWIAGHTHSDGTPVRPEFAETIEQIQSLDSQMDSTSGDNIREDAVSQVLGRDKPVRVRGMGRGGYYY